MDELVTQLVNDLFNQLVTQLMTQLVIQLMTNFSSIKEIKKICLLQKSVPNPPYF